MGRGYVELKEYDLALKHIYLLQHWLIMVAEEVHNRKNKK
jgi:hypothetical protein